MKTTQKIKSALAAVLLAIILIAAQPLQAGVYVELVDTSGAQLNTIPVNEPIEIVVKLDNYTGETLLGIQHGIQVYSPNGALWQPLTYSVASGLSSFLDFISIQGFGITGSGADTVGLSAVAAVAPGVPDGYTGLELFRINTMSSSYGDTICIDSSFTHQQGLGYGQQLLEIFCQIGEDHIAMKLASQFVMLRVISTTTAHP